jgi:hypothetical protein
MCTGHTIRAAGYRYTEWLAFDHVQGVADWTHPLGVELYEHDPIAKPTCKWDYEALNRQSDPALAATKAELAKVLRKASRVPRNGAPSTGAQKGGGGASASSLQLLRDERREQGTQARSHS